MKSIPNQGSMRRGRMGNRVGLWMFLLLVVVLLVSVVKGMSTLAYAG